MMMPTLREIVAGYEAANAWEREEERRRLPTLTVEESVRQYLEMWDLAQQVSPDAEAVFLEERMVHYEKLHHKLQRAARVMGPVDQDRIEQHSFERRPTEEESRQAGLVRLI